MNTKKYQKILLEEKIAAEESLSKIAKINKRGEWEAVPDTETIKQEVPDEADLAERAEDFLERAEMVEALNRKLGALDLALRKIAEGSYGVCEVCGGKIEEKRLEIYAHATTCIACMRKT